MDSLRIAPSPTYAREMIGARILEHAAQIGGEIEILEAGCGRNWNIDLGGISYRITGIDVDAEALRYREEIVNDLDVAIVGDLRTVDFQKGSFDVVFSAFVLEHISGAAQVLDRMVDALKPGGLLILRTPDGKSVYAFLARLLPFWTHVLYKRIADHDKLAGKPGHPPYRVVYDDIVAREGFRNYFDRSGLTLIEEVGTNPHLYNIGRLAPIGWAAQRTIAWLSRGRLSGTHSNLTLVAMKR